MLFARATSDGIRVTGFLDTPSLVLVTCKSSTGERRVVPLDCADTGMFTTDVAVKGFDVMDVVGIPIRKTKDTLYVARPVKNADELVDWFKSQGMKIMLAPDDMHVTIAFSKRRVDWEAVGETDEQELEMEPAFRRSVLPLGDKGAIVMTVKSDELQDRWAHFVSKGASWDYPEYQPHITLTYDNVDAGRFIPFPGRIILGPEKFKPVDSDYTPTLKARV